MSTDNTGSYAYESAMRREEQRQFNPTNINRETAERLDIVEKKLDSARDILSDILVELKEMNNPLEPTQEAATQWEKEYLQRVKNEPKP